MINKRKSRYIIILLITVILGGSHSTIFAFADNNKSNKNEKTRLEQHLEEQETDIKRDMGNIVPEDDTLITDTADQIMNAEYGDFNIDKKINSLTNFVNNILVKSRTLIVIVYALIVSCL